VEKEWLAQQLEAGRSMEDIAREVGKNPSTVAYWVNKHGLVSANAPKHQPRGPVGEAELRELVEEGLSVRQIAARLERGPASVRHWLRRYGLRTQPASHVASLAGLPDAAMRECATHGWGVHQRDSQGHVRCRACRADAVSRRRRKVKELLIEEAGGCCAVCGYDRYVGALHFHHRDPSQKRFGLSAAGVARALASCREEAAKCVLLCANCHAEVEAGLATLPVAVGTPPG
jgi:transposase-like protein